MNHTNTYYFGFLAILTLIVSLLYGCIREDLSDCSRPFQITIKALDADLNDITETGEVKQVALFVFDESGQVVEIFELSAEQVKDRQPIDIRLLSPGHKVLSFVAWANLDEKIDFSSPLTVKQKQDLFVRMKSQQDMAESPGDLFYGKLDVPVEYGGVEQGKSYTLPIMRKIASVIIIARNVQRGDEAILSFVLRESPDTYNADGELSGRLLSYKPTFTFEPAGYMICPIFNTFPAAGGKPYVVDMYRNGQLVQTFTRGADGKEFTPVLGRLLNIIIDVKSEQAVKVVVTPWGVVYQEVDY